jgi:hypothetical protein
MRRLLLSLLAMAALLFALDRAVGAGMARLFRTSQSEEEGDRFGRAIAARPAVVIVGSSRALHHYVADSLGTWLGAPAYNLGRDGSWGALYPYGVAGIALRHFRPRVFLLDVAADSYSRPETLDYLSVFLPYVDDEPAARELAGLRSRWEGVRMLSKTYPYNSLLLSLLAPKLGKAVHHRDGYLPLVGRMRPDTTSYAVTAPGPEAYPRDPLKWRYLGKTLALLRAHGVTPVAVRSPKFLAGDRSREIDRREGADVRRTFAELGVRYLDFGVLDHPELADPALYQDAEHLNDRGALRFTRELAESLQTTL